MLELLVTLVAKSIVLAHNNNGNLQLTCTTNRYFAYLRRNVSFCTKTFLLTLKRETSEKKHENGSLNVYLGKYTRI